MAPNLDQYSPFRSTQGKQSKSQRGWIYSRILRETTILAAETPLSVREARCKEGKKEKLWFSRNKNLTQWHCQWPERTPSAVPRTTRARWSPRPETTGATPPRSSGAVDSWGRRILQIYEERYASIDKRWCCTYSITNRHGVSCKMLFRFIFSDPYRARK